MLESGSSGSVRGASSNGRPYREPRSRAVRCRANCDRRKGRKAPVVRTAGQKWIAGYKAVRVGLLSPKQTSSIASARGKRSRPK
jgi:hypothetical protein